MTMADDPFAVFGDDDDDEEEVEEAPQELSWSAKKLMEQANARMAQQKEATDTSVPQNSAVEKDAAETLTLKTLELWPDHPPLYLGPMHLVASLPFGGGRGFVATRNLAPGTLILVEEPVTEWSDEQIGKALDLVSVLQLLTHPEALSIIHDMEDFHPTKQNVDEESGDKVQVQDMMQMLCSQHEDDDRLDAFIQLAKERNLSCRDGSELTARDILRLLLALRYNGLETGIYRHVAMLNHDCHPNCVKFRPTAGYSEVRTTRHVSMGESLTISYLPRIVSHATRRNHLWDQHRFDIGLSSLGEWRFMEFIGNSLPPSSIQNRDETSVTFGIENATSQLEENCSDVEAAIQADDSQANPAWDEFKAMEVASLELYTEAKNRLRNEHHILLIPCLRLHLDVCELVQRNLIRGQRILLLTRLVSSATWLLDLQERLLGRDHFDLARTHLEFAQAMEELLSKAPKQVVQLGLPGLSTFEACSTAEHKSRQEHERIRLLYPHDADAFIQAHREGTR
jgi:hypothetical protein